MYPKLTMLISLLLHLKLLSKIPVFATLFSGIREAFLSGDHEPWVFRGGLISDLLRLLPLDSGHDLYMFKYPEVPLSLLYNIRYEKCHILSLIGYNLHPFTHPWINKYFNGRFLRFIQIDFKNWVNQWAPTNISCALMNICNSFLKIVKTAEKDRVVKGQLMPSKFC